MYLWETHLHKWFQILHPKGLQELLGFCKHLCRFQISKIVPYTSYSQSLSKKIRKKIKLYYPLKFECMNFIFFTCLLLGPPIEWSTASFNADQLLKICSTILPKASSIVFVFFSMKIFQNFKNIFWTALTSI